jgi:hemerythrin
MRLEWTDDLCIGIAEIDRHNRTLVDVINQVQEALGEDPPPPSPRMLVDDLLEYIIYHFATQEIWMDRGKYRKSFPHIQDHLKYTEVIIAANKECHVGKITANDVVALASSEFIRHIKQFDSTMEVSERSRV